MLAMGLATATNRRRLGCNDLVRRIRGTKGSPPKTGEHVVCLKNMKTEGAATPIYNGMRGVLASDALDGDSDEQLCASIGFPDDGIEPQEFNLLAAQFNREGTFSSPQDLLRETGLRSLSEAGALFDFGYALTCHKMQGSQYEDLVVVAEKMGPMSMEDWTRWQYTAVTRAAERLTVLR
jgi:exodeoxyribonuclease-5